MTDTTAYATGDHQVSGDGPPPPPPPLTDVPAVRRRTPAEEARTLVSLTSVATLATLSDDGTPWASLVGYAALEDGSPVLMVSTLAEHGRNLERDTRASLVVASPEQRKDPLAAGRVTLAGRIVRPSGETEERARAAYRASVPASSIYSEFGDFSLYVLDVERVRWVGGYGRMDSADPPSYAGAEADPVGEATGAIKHLNEDHADALLIMAQALAGYPDAESARCTAADRYGLDLMVGTPRGSAPARVGFAEPVTEAAGLRAATVELTQRARATAAAATD